VAAGADPVAEGPAEWPGVAGEAEVWPGGAAGLCWASARLTSPWVSGLPPGPKALLPTRRSAAVAPMTATTKPASSIADTTAARLVISLLCPNLESGWPNVPLIHP
jgi:hypothetical protein